MAGTSDREKAAQDQQKQLQQMLAEIQGTNFGGNIDEIINAGKGDIERETAQNIADYQKGVSGRYASQGIAGPMLEEAITEGRSKLAKNKYGALSRLTQAGAGMKMDALFKKFGLRGNTLGQMQNNIGNFSDDTWLDDALGILNTGAGFINPLDKLIGGDKKNKGGIAPIDF